MSTRDEINYTAEPLAWDGHPILLRLPCMDAPLTLEQARKLHDTLGLALGRGIVSADAHWLLFVEGQPEPVIDGPYLPDEATAIEVSKRAERHEGRPVRLLAARLVYETEEAPQRMHHAMNEHGDCPSWCQACRIERAQRDGATS